MPYPLEHRAVLRTFLASPQDVAAEREVAAKIVEELNLIWSRFLGLALELIRWETHAWPGADVDPQALINRQLGDDYELFIGIMWSRFGSATNRADSGTQEEFERAYARCTADQNSVRIMFYFRSSPPPPDADSVQLSQVEQFRRRLVADGVLSWDYENQHTFESLLRLHLSRQMQDFYRNAATVPRDSTLFRRRPQNTVSLLRLLPAFVVQTIRVLIHLHRLTGRLRRLSMIGVAAGARVKAIDLNRPDARFQFDTAVQDVATEMLQFVGTSRSVVVQLQLALEGFWENLSRMAPWFVGSRHGAVRAKILEELNHLRSVIESGMPPFEGLQNTMQQYAEIHPGFQRVSPVATEFFGDVLAVWTRALQLIDEAERTYSNF